MLGLNVSENARIISHSVGEKQDSAKHWSLSTSAKSHPRDAQHSFVHLFMSGTVPRCVKLPESRPPRNVAPG